VVARARAQAAIAAANQADTPIISQVLDGHVTLEVECLDRVYLNAYVPNLQVGGQVVRFLTGHLGNPIPSLALFGPIGERFRAAVARFAKARDIPVVRFGKDERKQEVMRPYLEAAQAAGQAGWSRSGWRRSSSGSSVAMTTVVAMGSWARPGMDSRRPTGGSAATTSTSGTSSSAPGSSSCAAPSPGRPRCGSTATSGPSSRPASRASALPSWQAGSRPATTRIGCSRCATGSAPGRSRRSSTAGWPTSRPRLGPPTALAGTVGAVDAPDRGLPHPGPGCPRAGAGVLCGAGGRQPRHRPARRGLADL
jgi:hypothetical protein